MGSKNRYRQGRTYSCLVGGVRGIRKTSKTAIRYLESVDADESHLSKAEDLGKSLEKMYFTNLKQASITDYFAKIL